MASQKGTVSKFNDKRGFGFITPEKGGDEVFCHWEAIQTDDRWPKLAAGTKVQYKTEVDEKGKTRAISVTKPGGGKLTFTGDDEKQYGDFRYPGTVKWFRGRTGAEGGFGFITLTMEATVGGDTIAEGTDVYVSREEILHENPVNPKVAKGMEVEFLVAKYNDKYMACEVTLPDGVPVTEDAMPAREEGEKRPKGGAKGGAKGGKSKGKGKGKGKSSPVQKTIQKSAPKFESKPAKGSKGKGKGASTPFKSTESKGSKGAGKGSKGKGKGKGR